MHKAPRLFLRIIGYAFVVVGNIVAFIGIINVGCGVPWGPSFMSGPSPIYLIPYIIVGGGLALIGVGILKLSGKKLN